MDLYADDAGEQSRSQHTRTRLQDGRSLRVQSIFTADPHVTRRTFVDAGTSLRVENHGNASPTSAVYHGHCPDRDSSRTEAQMYGFSCFVRKLKPARLGCAIVEFTSASMREDVMDCAQQLAIVNGVPTMTIRGISVNVRRHVDNYRTAHRQEVRNSVFLSWSHCVEKQSPLPLREIVDAFDVLVAQIEAPQPGALPAPDFIT
eukprot:TRINITY_DN18168_c0_g1_i5.p1 TRINITY_DN18168_c0_g1~~TRINITY_DN18168_c0_g1_i5.p1  ORF type:complete len:224 (+),score=16.46 TRINITY_DN18168_c0_g1_i5:66-674(+)